MDVAESILAGFSQSLDRLFYSQRYRRARLPGFGVLEPVDLGRSQYWLTLELPLAQFLRLDRLARSDPRPDIGE